MKQLHTTLFLYIDGKMRVFCKKNDEIISLKEQGIEEFSLDSELIGGDFWAWWRRKVGFIEGDSTDFCFIYDNFDSRLLLDSTKDNKISAFWSLDGIKYVFNKLGIEANLHSANDIIIPFGKNPSKECWTNLEFNLGVKSDYTSDYTSENVESQFSNVESPKREESEMEACFKKLYENRPSNQGR